MNEDLEKKITKEERKRKNMKKAREEFGVEVGEDSTKYGEFISSYFAWVSLPEQKEKAKKLQTMTKKQNEVDDKK
ncbi:MAG: hypothetical protein HFJ27_00260 [Clostridia bacterium]|nr:hypothetical protein [Clostridia bacterium]